MESNDGKELAEHNKKELQLFSELGQVINHESDQLVQLEKTLHKELKEIKHLEHNLAVLEKKFEKFKVMFAHRNQLIRTIMHESYVPDDKLNIRKLEDLLHLALKFNTEVHSQVQPTYDAMYKLHSETVQKVQAATDHEKEIIAEIGEKARVMTTEFKLLFTASDAFNQDIQNINQRIQNIKNSAPRNTVGF